MSDETQPALIAQAWHDVTCPEGPECRDRPLHAASEALANSGHLARFLDRLAELRPVGPAGDDTPPDDWQVVPPDDPGCYDADGWAVATSEWAPGTTDDGVWIAERMSRATAELLVAAHAARVSPDTARPVERRDYVAEAIDKLDAASDACPIVAVRDALRLAATEFQYSRGSVGGSQYYASARALSGSSPDPATPPASVSHCGICDPNLDDAGPWEMCEMHRAEFAAWKAAGKPLGASGRSSPDPATPATALLRELAASQSLAGGRSSGEPTDVD